jgi:hypothetical protein
VAAEEGIPRREGGEPSIRMRLIDGSYVYASLGDGEEAESRIKQLRRGDIIPSTQDGLHTVWVPQSAVVWFEEHKFPTLEEWGTDRAEDRPPN